MPASLALGTEQSAKPCFDPVPPAVIEGEELVEA